MKEKPSTSLEEDTEEMKKWRGMSQEEMDQFWRRLAEKMDEEVLDKCKVDDSKRGAYTGRGFLLERRRAGKSKKHRIKKWREDYWARVFYLFGEHNLQRMQSNQGELTEGE